VALDPGSSTITIALGGVNDDGKLQLADIVTAPMQGIVRGEIANRQQVSACVSEAIRQVEQKHGLRISDLYMGASGKQIKCANHDYYVYVADGSDGEITKNDVDKLHEMMNNIQCEEGVRILDRIPLGYVIDGSKPTNEPVGMFGKKIESTFNFVLASSTLLDRMDKTLLALNIATRRTFAGAMASAEAVLLPEEKEMGVAVVDLGAGTTDLSVWYKGTVRFVRGIPLGAADIDNDLRQQGIPEKRIEELKKTFGFAMASLVESDKLITIAGRSPREKREISQRNLAIIIENRLSEIIGYVMAEIGDSGYADRLKGGIVLSGGGAGLKGIDKLFLRETGMEVRIALPDVNVADDCLALAQDPAYSTAIGLLLKAAELGKGQRGGTVEVPPPVRPVQPERNDTPAPPRVVTPTKEPRTSTEPVFEGDGEDDKHSSRGGWFKRLGKKVMNNIMPEELDGDEDI
jgi:cell division protein FtsA